MKTQLPEKISNVDEAKTFLGALIYNNEIYHLDDDAHDIIWDLPEGQEPTAEEKDQLNKLMDDIFILPECDNQVLTFDPHGFCLDLENRDEDRFAIDPILEALNAFNDAHDKLKRIWDNNRYAPDILNTDYPFEKSFDEYDVDKWLFFSKKAASYIKHRLIGDIETFLKPNRDRKNVDTPDCEKCGGRTALVKGAFEYQPHDEPYISGVEEEPDFFDGSFLLYGYRCDDCENVQGLWHE